MYNDSLATIATEYQIYQQERPTLSHRHGIIPQGHLPTIWFQVDYIGHPLYWNRYFSGCGVIFPACNASPKPQYYKMPYMHLENALIATMEFNTLLHLTHKFTSQSEKCDSGPTKYVIYFISGVHFF